MLFARAVTKVFEQISINHVIIMSKPYVLTIFIYIFNKSVIFLFQQDFESVFQEFQHDAVFNYLKSFRRARVNFLSPISAAKARIRLNEATICGKIIKCYFAQVRTLAYNMHICMHIYPCSVQINLCVWFNIFLFYATLVEFSFIYTGHAKFVEF